MRFLRAATLVMAGTALVTAGWETRPIAQTAPATRYVGSPACRSCHSSVYDQWKRTLMANVVRDPREHPDAIIPDLTKPDPLVTFTRSQVAFVYGSKWKQRYFTKIGDDYFPFGAQWDVTHRLWRPYFVAANTDWWTAHYEADDMKRPTGPLCDGCHSVNYEVQTKSVTEWNVGCERCHGPGREHVAEPSVRNIVNPARVEPFRANDISISCHSQGEPTRNPIAGRYYDWPVGYHVGLNLNDFWTLDSPTLGTQTFTYFADGTSHKNRMQGNDFVTTRMYAKGVTCWSCHQTHGSPYNAVLRRPHTFRFIPPSATDRLKVPNPCTSCHEGKTTAWASDELKKWPEFSVWRVAE